MVKQFAFALGVTTCLSSIDLAHSKANNIFFSEALEGARSSLRKSISLRTMYSKQQWLLQPQALGRSGGNHGIPFDLGKLRGSLTSPFLRLNRPESPIISRFLLGNLLSASQETRAPAVPRRSISLFTASSTLQKDKALPFFTSIKTPAPRQFFFGNVTVTPRTTHAFLAQQNSNPFQRLLTVSSPVTPFKSPSASFLSHFRAPKTHQLSLRDTVFAPRNTALVLRNLGQPQSSFTAPFVKNIVEEPTISLKEAFAPIRTITKPTPSPVLEESLPSSPEISLASIFKSLVSTAISSRVSPQTQSVTPSLREEARDRDVASIVSESPSSLSHNERSFLQSPQEDVMRPSFPLTASTPLEQEERSSHLSVEENSTSLLPDSSLSSSLLKKEQLDEEPIERSPSISSEPRFSSQSERQERPEVSLSEQSSESLIPQEHNPISEEQDRPLTKDALMEPVSLVTNREVAPVITPSEDNEMELRSALVEDDTAQRSQSEQALEQQRVREQREREEREEQQERLKQRRLEKLEWAEKEQHEWERIEAQHLKQKKERERLETQRLLEERLKRENEERLEHERVQAQRLLEEQRLERERREKLEWAEKEQREWEHIEAQHLEKKQKRIAEQRVQRENEGRLQRELLEEQQRVQRQNEERIQRENQERVERDEQLEEQQRIQRQNEERIQRENEERIERERVENEHRQQEQLRLQQEEQELLNGFVVVGEEDHQDPENVDQQQPLIPVLQHQVPAIIDNYQPPRQNDAPPVVGQQQQQQQPQGRGGLFGWGLGIGGVNLL